MSDLSHSLEPVPGDGQDPTGGPPVVNRLNGFRAHDDAGHREAERVRKAKEFIAPPDKAGVNITVDPDRLAHLPAEVQATVIWFHQHVLDRRLTWKEAADAVGYDTSTVNRVLRGRYDKGSYENVCRKIEEYRRLFAARTMIHEHAFAPNDIYGAVAALLDFSLANHAMGMVIGDSGMGKTESCRAWRDRVNPGRTVVMTAPATGGTHQFLTNLSAASGLSIATSKGSMMDRLLKSYNRNRILIVDQAHRLLPGAGARTAHSLEVLMDLHDLSGAAVVLVATARLREAFAGDRAYMFEQILGRVALTCPLPPPDARMLAPIVAQYFHEPSAALQAEFDRLAQPRVEDRHSDHPVLRKLTDLANEPGRLRLVVKTLQVASRMASNKKVPLQEEHVTAALALRRQMMAERLPLLSGGNNGKGGR